MVRADRDEEKGAEAFQKYAIRGTPTTIVLDGAGAEVDWIVGYSAPPEKFQAKVNRSLTGGETLKSLTAVHAANSKDVATAFKLGRKYAERADEAKALPLYKDVVALDPAGKAGSLTPDFIKAPVTYTQYAEYEIARFPLQGRRDPALMKAYIAKYPRGPMTRLAYSSLDIFYYGGAPAAEADAFYAEYTAKFPNETWVFQKWLTRILQDKTSLDKGVAVADRLTELTESNPDPYAQAVLAEFYFARGDKAKAEEVFGKPFIDSHLSNIAFGLLQYADFWAQRHENTDSVESAVAAALKLQPENMFVRQQAAKVFLGLGREAGAIEVFGPAYARTYWDEPGELRSYIYFWTQQGKNLDGALAAGLRTVALRPRAYYHWSALADLYLKMGDKTKALDAAAKAVEFASPAARPAMQKNLDKIKGQVPTPAPVGPSQKYSPELGKRGSDPAAVPAFDGIPGWNWAGAEREARKAIGLTPNATTARLRLGGLLVRLGRFDEGLDEMERARKIDPASPQINDALASGYYWARRYDQAIAVHRRTLKADPRFTRAHLGLAFAYLQQGKADEALTEGLAAVDPQTDSVEAAGLGYVFAAAGKKDEALKIADRLAGRDGRAAARPGLAYPLGVIYAALGLRDPAFAWFEKAYAGNSPELSVLKIDPRLDDLRGDPRYLDLVKRLKFPEN